MIKYGQVQAYDPQTGTATIAYVRPDACAKCGGCSSMNQTNTIDLKCVCDVGDWVRIVLPDGHFMGAMGMAYGLPLGLFLGGLAAGYLLSGRSEGWAIVGSFIGLGLSLIALKLNERRISGKPEWTPRVDGVYKDRPPMDDVGCGGA